MGKNVGVVVFFILSLIAFSSAAQNKKSIDDEKKISICHVPPGNIENSHVISIGRAALDAHLAHGDILLSNAIVHETSKGKTRCSKKTTHNHWVEIRPQ